MFPIGEAPALDGMFAFVLFEEGVEGGDGAVALAARDPCGIKPLYMGRATEQNGGGYIFSSELKALVDQVQADTVLEVPAGVL
jgi:asparagine synthase (glutamine-hydrolysing)